MIRRDLVLAERELRTAVDLKPDYLGAFVNSVLASFEKHADMLRRSNTEVDYLIPLLRLAVRLDPAYNIARANLAIAFLKFGRIRASQGNHEAALELFYSALAVGTEPVIQTKIRSHIAAILTALAQEKYRMNDPVSAFTLLKTAFLVAEDELTRRNFGIAFGNLATFKMKAEQFHEAAALFERAEDVGILEPQFLNDYGVCLVFLGARPQAIRAFERALEMADNGLAQSNLSRIKAQETVSADELSRGNDRAWSDVSGEIPKELLWRKPEESAASLALA